MYITNVNYFYTNINKIYPVILSSGIIRCLKFLCKFHNDNKVKISHCLSLRQKKALTLIYIYIERDLLTSIFANWIELPEIEFHSRQ